MTLLEYPVSVLNHPRVHRAIDALERDKSYEPRTKRPIPPSVFYQVLLAIPYNPVANILRSLFLTLYYGALRQGEIMPASVNEGSSCTHPTRGDVTISDDECIILIKFGKTLQKVGQYRRVHLAAAADQALCPVAAMRTVLYDTPTLSAHDPLFMFPCTRAPVPISFAKKELTRLLVTTGHQTLVPHISLHSLRKAAATNAYLAGCDQLSIKRFGAWSSDAYTAYISTSNYNVKTRR